MTGLELVREYTFSTVYVTEGDSIHVTAELRDALSGKIEIVRHDDSQPAPGKWNCMRIYRAEEFGGIENAYLTVLGWKPPEKKIVAKLG